MIYFRVLALFLIVVKETITASSPVTWTNSPLFVTGTSLVNSGQFGYAPAFSGPFSNQVVTVMYGLTMTGVSRQIALGLINFNYDLTDTNLYFRIIMSALGTNGFQANFSSNMGSYFLSTTRISYLTVDPAFTQSFSISYFNPVLL